MNVIGETLRITASTDESKTGLTGKVLLESAKTLLLNLNGMTLRVEKEGNIFQVLGSGDAFEGSTISGRLEDRLGVRTA